MPPPLKKRRLPPDGFLTTPVHKPVVPQFSSAFNKHQNPSKDSPSQHASILQLRPPPKPPVTLLKPAVPPPPLLVNKPSSKDLKSLQPPPVPLPSNSAIDIKNLRTISKTRVALATDLSTDTGVAELASIFLHDQHPDINSHPDNHHRRGLELSPEKKGKGKHSKFVRYVFFSYLLPSGSIIQYLRLQRWFSSSCVCNFPTLSNLSRLMAKGNGTSPKHTLILRFARQHRQDPTKTASLT